MGDPGEATLTILESARNFRDLGGVEAEHQRLTKRGLVYRAGAPKSLSSADEQTLQRIGLKTIVDLRTPEEAEKIPYSWSVSSAVNQLVISGQSGDLTKYADRLDGENLTRSEVRNLMIEFYPRIVDTQTFAIKEVFALLSKGAVPLLFHCSAGKDRTGVIAALVLLVLGVSKEQVVEDYLATNNLVDYRLEWGLDDPSDANPYFAQLGRISADIIEPLLLADADYLMSALDHIERQYGSISGFLEIKCDMKMDKIDDIKELLLE